MATGSVKVAGRSGSPSTSQSEDNVATVWEMFSHSPSKSTHQAASECGLSRYAIRKVLKKELDFRLWKPHHVRELTPEDCDRRMEYGKLMLGWHKDFPQLLENILWSDEAIFHVGGFVNRHSYHYWAAQDPNMMAEKMQNRLKVTVWYGMTATSVIGPYLLRDTMNSQCYLQMLQDYVWPTVSRWENIDDLIFMQDGGPPHFSNAVRAWLGEKFPGHWLGQCRPHEWPSRSPDLTPCDFFLCAKDEVYHTKPRTLKELEARIRNVITNVPHKFLQKTVDSIPGRLRKLVDITGAYIKF
jgi:hypothetical protein